MLVRVSYWAVDGGQGGRSAVVARAVGPAPRSLLVTGRAALRAAPTRALAPSRRRHHQGLAVGRRRHHVAPDASAVRFFLR